MIYLRSVTATVLAGLFLLLGGCNTPDAIAKFCGSSITALSSANAVFDDMKQSCLREVNSRHTLGSFQAPVQTDAACSATAGDGAKEAVKILLDLFAALNSLASFNTAKAGTDAHDVAAKGTLTFGGSSAAQTAVGDIAKFIVSAATSGYQQKKLSQDIRAVSGNVTVVIDALVTIIQTNYQGQLLSDEEKKISGQYQGFVDSNSTTEKPLPVDTRLALYDRWQAQEAAIVAKRASAQSLVSGLKSISKGLADLAANSNKFSAKDLDGLLAPYVSQIQALIPEIQKAF